MKNPIILEFIEHNYLGDKRILSEDEVIAMALASIAYDLRRIADHLDSVTRPISGLDRKENIVIETLI